MKNRNEVKENGEVPIKSPEQIEANAGRPNVCRPTDPCCSNIEPVKAPTANVPETPSPPQPMPVGDDCCSAKEHEIAALGQHEEFAGCYRSFCRLLTFFKVKSQIGVLAFGLLEKGPDQSRQFLNAA